MLKAFSYDWAYLEDCYQKGQPGAPTDEALSSGQFESSDVTDTPKHIKDLKDEYQKVVSDLLPYIKGVLSNDSFSTQ